MTAGLNGTRPDGHQAVRAAVPLSLAGPVLDWPQRTADVHPAPVVSRPRGDRFRRASMWVLASGVAAIAAVVSYSHIYDLGRAHGGSGVPARLLPLSVDMLILVGELMLLHEADGKGRRFILGWVLVWSGILATLAANVAFGAQFGVVGAIIWGWPAYSFILAAGGMVAVVKRGADRDIQPDAGVDNQADIPVADETESPLVNLDTEVDTSMDIQVAAEAVKSQGRPKASPRTSRRTLSAAEKVAAVLKDDPDLSNAEAARRAGVSAKTVQRVRNGGGRQ